MTPWEILPFFAVRRRRRILDTRAEWRLFGAFRPPIDSFCPSFPVGGGGVCQLRERDRLASLSPCHLGRSLKIVVLVGSQN